MIYMKIILAVILSAIPFFFHYYVQPRRQDEKWKNLSTFISTHNSWYHKANKKIQSFGQWLYEGMQRHDSFRKFFTRIMLFVIMVYECVDFNAAQEAKIFVNNYVENTSYLNVDNIVYASVYIPGNLMITNFWVSLFGFLVSLPLLSHQWADRTLLWIKKELPVFSACAGITLLLTIFPHVFILAEMTAIILLASCVYPFKRWSDVPKGRMGIQKDENKRKAA